MSPVVVTAGEREWLAALADPLSVRQVRVPSRFTPATSCVTYHGNVTFQTNSAGFARIAYQLVSGSIILYNDIAHTDTVLGPSSTLLASPFPGTNYARICSAGLKVRSTSSFSNESGMIQAYSSLLGASNAYDVYRDSPHQMIYNKGQVAICRYLPVDNSELELQNLAAPGIIGSHVIGVMVVGGGNAQTYNVQYAITLEYVSGSNTDLVPQRLAPLGDPHKVAAGVAHNNHASSAWTQTADFVRQHGVSVVGGAVTGFAAGGPAGAAAGAGVALTKSLFSGGITHAQASQASGNHGILSIQNDT